MKYLLEHEKTERLYFKNANVSQFDEWLEFFKDPASFEHWAGQLNKPEIECKKWFVRQADRYANDEGGMNALIEKKSGKLIGYCGLLVQTVDTIPELEVGYSMIPTFRNKGFAIEAAKKCRDFSFENNFSDSLISIISLTNLPSVNVATKNGMRVEKQCIYKENEVNIFRIYKTDWFKNKSE